MSKEDDIREILNQAVKVISGVQSNPRTWQSWMVYLLAQLEAEATQRSTAYNDSFPICYPVCRMQSGIACYVKNLNKTAKFYETLGFETKSSVSIPNS